MRILKVITAIALLVPGFTLGQSKTISGFGNASAAQYELEKHFDAQLKPTNIDKLIREMSANPHHIGSAGSKAVAEYIYTYFRNIGLDARIETYYSLFAAPRERLLELTGPKKFRAVLAEPALKEDASSGQKGQLPTYNCFSPDGDVTAELVFVNYGIPEDYEVLRQKGIEVKGKIVIAKYGRSWRGIKPKVAQEHGAVGCIIYSDPRDDGYFAGDVYPKGAYKNEYGVQRGSVMDMPVYPGDPLSPGYAHKEGVKLLDKSEATNLLRIPVLPISYHDAEPLLRSLEGPVAPENWRGGLPFTYHIGPSKEKVHLKLQFDWEIKPLYNVIAQIKGSEFPDQWVIRGNHHDAWVNGASDPISGMAALMEEARAVAELLKQGWKPKRSILYCGWDGEEAGLLGSTEWVEDHAKELQQKVVVYINSDGNGRGFFGAGGSHALETLMNEVARDVPDPQTQVSIYERSLANRIANAGSAAKQQELINSKTTPLHALGAGSDYSPFFQHLGIPSLNLGFGGENGGGEYHSIYDSYDNYKRFKDPEFTYGVALAKAAGRTTLRMANAANLPFDYTLLSKTINGYANEVMNLLEESREKTRIENQVLKNKYYQLAADPTLVFQAPDPKEEVPFLDFSPLQNALKALESASSALKEGQQKTDLGTAATQRLNQALYRAEQQLLYSHGLPRREWYRHSIYAPGFYTGYGVKTLPGIREAIEQRNWIEAQQQIEQTASAIQQLAQFLQQSIQ